LLQLAAFGAALFALYLFGGVRYPTDPALEQTASFERHYRLIGSFPFVTSYFLFTPKDYDPARNYPLVLSLHGASKRSFEAFHLTKQATQQANECFVLLPMAPPYWGWANRDGSVAALAIAVDILDEVVAEYSIDTSRIYVTGHSMGGTGTFAALAHYPKRFAAGVAVNGYWPPSEAAKFKNQNLWVFHGEKDPIFPLELTQGLVREIAAKGGDPKFTLMKGVGHTGLPAYRDPALWQWLFDQRIGASPLAN
jgi:predicted peptidase